MLYVTDYGALSAKFRGRDEEAERIQLNDPEITLSTATSN